MARFRKPKPFSVLLKTIAPDKLMSLLARYGATNEAGEYLHWDKFIWRVEKGIDEEAAWVATKFARKAIAKPVTLLTADSPEQSFSYCIPDSLFAQLHYIDKVTGGGHTISDSPFITSREKDRYLVKNLMIEEAITSSQLEGASTTRKVAKEMLESNRKPTDKSEQMIFNNFLLMKKALERKDEPLSIELILELHAIATYKAIDNDAVSGELRVDNTVTVADMYNEVAHQPPCASTLKERLQDLCTFANACDDSADSKHFMHPLVKAIILHFMVGYIHPFGDGNGRTARALFYWSMLKAGYWLFEYISISKLIQEKRSDYGAAYIYTETDDFDLTYFIYHQVDIVTKAVNSLHSYIESKKSDFYQFMEWVDKSPVLKGLKRGQLEILKEAVKQPGKIFTAKQVSIELDVNENTARSYLNQLANEQLLMASKQKGNKTIAYLAPAGLRERFEV
ncbi:Fic family protein [Oceanisphaera pacifica]|uniref:Fic family protein n=1 Tax=Oceanisphaera pacifica TaxID=2818389 RepID=A0ABS3NKH3_9GAMM|nr:Fic family protein [Oceanisphaera pacifica]MBO1520726.1 Fic family protein [Oceanisphaera pacifica]